jgi:phage tail sheath protein FI
MAETIISPGVFTRENDISFIQPAPVAAGAAIIGPAVKGPVEVPTLVTSYNDYVRKFGTTFSSGSTSFEFLTSIAAKNYFQQGGNSLLVSRVVTGSFGRATSTNITNLTTATGLGFASGSLTLARVAVDNQEFRVGNISSGGSTLTYRFVASGNPIPTDDTDGLVFFFSTGSTAAASAENLKEEINSAFAGSHVSASVDSAKIILSGSAAGIAANGITFSTGSETGTFESDNLLGFTLAGGSNTTTATTNSFLLETLGKGIIYNNSTGATDAGVHNTDSSLVSGSSDNLRWEVSNVNSSLGTFTLSIRQGDDSLKNKVVLETYNNLSLDPNNDNYIEKVIGNQYQQINTSETPNYIETIGEHVNKSNFVRVSAVNAPTLDYLGNDGLTVRTDGQNVSYSASLPIAQSGSFHGATGALFSSDREAKFFKNISNTDTQGLTAGCYTNIISVLENTDDYQFNILSAPGLIYDHASHITPLDSIISLTETRGDAIAVIDLVEHGSTVSTVTTQAGLLNTSYAAAYWPWLQTQSATGRNEFIPASVVIPGVYAFTDSSSAPWFAPAGLVRGGITGVIQAERRLTRTQRDTLYSDKVNPIASFPGQGISVFGQKTLQTKASALDRVNVRRLLIALKKFIGDQARTLVFEQNTITTRNRFLAAVNPYLESVVQRQGLFAFRVVMDDTNNTADVVDRNQLIGQIFIQPAKTAEFIVLDFTIEPTGATFAG